MNQGKNYSFTNELESLGLSKDESFVYEFLLQSGRSTAGNIRKNVTHVSRPMIYVILENLISKKLVEKKELDGSVAIFLPLHPLSLNSLVEEKESSLNRAKGGLTSVLGKLTSLYTLQNGTPGIEYFEGKKAIDEVLNDSLTATEVVLQYLDVDAQEKLLSEVNAEYQKNRKESKIEKKIISFDTKTTIQAYKNDAENGFNISNVRLISAQEKNFGVSIMIYNSKVSFLSFNEKNEIVGIIIHNKEIYQMQKFLFDSLFATGKPSRDH